MGKILFAILLCAMAFSFYIITKEGKETFLKQQALIESGVLKKFVINGMEKLYREDLVCKDGYTYEAFMTTHGYMILVPKLKMENEVLKMVPCN